MINAEIIPAVNQAGFMWLNLSVSHPLTKILWLLIGWSSQFNASVFTHCDHIWSVIRANVWWMEVVQQSATHADTFKYIQVGWLGSRLDDRLQFIASTIHNLKCTLYCMYSGCHQCRVCKCEEASVDYLMPAADSQERHWQSAGLSSSLTCSCFTLQTPSLLSF